jgi:hypothetical protein
LRRMLAIGGEAKTIASKAKSTQEKARRVLQAAAVEAYGRPGVYVARDPVMRRAGISDPEEFWAIAEYLNWKGYIAESDADYGIFVLTLTGIDEVTK